MYNKDNYVDKIDDIFNLKNLENSNNIVFMFSSQHIGNNEDKLNLELMEEYFHFLTELDFLPRTIILYGDAVLLSLDSSKIYISLKILKNKGVEILICEKSAKYYEVENRITIGTLVSIKTILEKNMAATKLINL